MTQFLLTMGSNMSLKSPCSDVKPPGESEDPEGYTNDNLKFPDGVQMLREWFPLKSSKELKAALTSAVGSPDQAAELLLDCPSPKGIDTYSEESAGSPSSTSNSASVSGMTRKLNLDSASPERITSAELHTIDDLVEREKMMRLMDFYPGHTFAQAREALKRSHGNVEEAGNALFDSLLVADGEDFASHDLGRALGRLTQPTKPESVARKKGNLSNLPENDTNSESESSDDESCIDLTIGSDNSRNNTDIEREDESFSDDETSTDSVPSTHDDHMSSDTKLDPSSNAKAARLQALLPCFNLEECKVELQLAYGNFDEALKTLKTLKASREGQDVNDSIPGMLKHLSPKRRAEFEEDPTPKKRCFNLKGNGGEQDTNDEPAGQWIR